MSLSHDVIVDVFDYAGQNVGYVAQSNGHNDWYAVLILGQWEPYTSAQGRHVVSNIGIFDTRADAEQAVRNEAETAAADLFVMTR